MAYEPMAEGPYWARVLDGQCIEVGQKQTPCMTVECEITHRAGNDEWIGLHSPAKRTLRLFLSDAAWPYTEAKLKKLGFNGSFGDPSFAGEAVTEGLELVCKHEHNDGKTYERWELADYGGNGETVQPPDDVLRRLSARWKTSQAASAKPAGRPKTPPKPVPVDDGRPIPPPEYPEGEAPAFEDNDIPF